jgi:hypothetical protein
MYQDDNIPDDANISNIVHEDKDGYAVVDANVEIFDNGDVFITHNDITWSYKNSNKLPTEEPKRLYSEYGVDFNNDEPIQIKFYKYNSNMDLTDKEYLSDCGEYILEPHTI